MKKHKWFVINLLCLITIFVMLILSNKPVDPATQQLKLVRNYLKQSLENPNWTEIEFYPAYDLNEERIVRLKNSISDNSKDQKITSVLEAELKRLEKKKSKVRICRLKYQVIEDNEIVLKDDFFWIQSQEAVLVDDICEICRPD